MRCIDPCCGMPAAPDTTLCCLGSAPTTPPLSFVLLSPPLSLAPVIIAMLLCASAFRSGTFQSWNALMTGAKGRGWGRKMEESGGAAEADPRQQSVESGAAHTPQQE
ncbi:unnamed protein product [Calypogeia fissa]